MKGVCVYRTVVHWLPALDVLHAFVLCALDLESRKEFSVMVCAPIVRSAK